MITPHHSFRSVLHPYRTLQRHAYARYRDIEIRQHHLLYLFFEITRRCNLNCIHCGSDCSAALPPKELTTDSWIAIARYIAEHFDPKPSIVITGGEPLVHPDLDRIAKALDHLGFRWGMVTNGILLSADRLARLTDRGLASITVSLDGLERHHRFIRNTPRAFDRAQAALKAIAASSVPERDVVTCVYPGNVDELDLIAELLLSLGVNTWRLFRIFPLGRAAGNGQLLLTFDQTHRMLTWIRDNREKYRDRGLAISYSCEGYLPFDLDRQIREEPFFCRSGVNIASILSDGSITGCNNNPPHLSQGNIMSDDFATVWLDRFQPFRDRSWMRTGPCAQCRDWKFCLGGSLHLRPAPQGETAFCYLSEPLA